MVKQAITIKLSEKQHKILEEMVKGTHTPLHFIKRAKIILMAAEGKGNREISRECHIDRHTVKLWRRRWDDMSTDLERTENETLQALKQLIRDTLSDSYRLGRPRYFTEAQIADIITLAYESPEDKGLPFSHWTPSALAEQAKKEHIVEQISPRSVARYLKEADLKPHHH